MWVSRRTDYATRAILALLRSRAEGRSSSRSSLAYGVPQSVLEQVMPTMRTAGIVRPERGPAGGYRLNKDPAEDHPRAHRAPVPRAAGADQLRHTPQPRAVPHDRRVHAPRGVEEVRDATITLLGGVTFADLAKRAGGPVTDPSLVTAEAVAG